MALRGPTGFPRPRVAGVGVAPGFHTPAVHPSLTPGDGREPQPTVGAHAIEELEIGGPGPGRVGLVGDREVEGAQAVEAREGRVHARDDEGCVRLEPHDPHESRFDPEVLAGDVGKLKGEVQAVGEEEGPGGAHAIERREGRDGLARGGGEADEGEGFFDQALGHPALVGPRDHSMERPFAGRRGPRVPVLDLDVESLRLEARVDLGEEVSVELAARAVAGPGLAGSPAVPDDEGLEELAVGRCAIEAREDVSHRDLERAAVFHGPPPALGTRRIRAGDTPPAGPAIDPGILPCAPMGIP